MAKALSEEPVDAQRTVATFLVILKRAIAESLAQEKPGQLTIKERRNEKGNFMAGGGHNSDFG